jgi:beta-mannosidase
MKFPHHTRQSLDGQWLLALDFEEKTVTRIANFDEDFEHRCDARVPGNFELDLQRAGIIEEPFFADNILALRRYETAHLWYARTFHLEPREHCQKFLRFDGLDCVSEVFLNGAKIGDAANALVPHEFCCNPRAGENEIVIHIRPAVEEAAKFTYPAGVGAFAANYESLYVRKAPHSFGWDIMPRALSAGIWRGVALVQKPIERLDETFLRTVSCDERGAKLLLHFNASLQNFDDCEIEIEGVCGDSRFYARRKILFPAGRLNIEIENPRLWWPRGRGDASLYQVTVKLFRSTVEIDRTVFMHGIRTIELERTSVTNENGDGAFCFRANGEKIFILGTNWMAADAYHSRDRERLPQMLELLDEIGCNAVRCWGGNVYEDDLFYDWCDEHGVLVWQDFALACAVYPQDEAFQSVLRDEAEKIIKRLRHHASLALWAGDNECDEAHAWFACGDPNKNLTTRKTLPEAVRAHDPGRVFLPSSPFIDDRGYAAGARYLPEQHLWGPRDNFKSDYYRNSLCHFASEIGYHGCSSPASIRRFISEENVWPPDNAEWLLHGTSAVPGVSGHDYRVQLMSNQIRELFGTVPDNLEDFAFASQSVQAEAKKFFIEMFRAAKWRRTGIVWWNLIDGWPQFSDAVVDYYFEKKRAFETIKLAQQPLHLILREPQNWAQELVACNDTRENLEVFYIVRDIETDEILCEGTREAKADHVTVLASIPFSTGAKHLYLLNWSSIHGEGRSHYLAGLPPFDLETYRSWMQKTGM